MCQFVVPLHTSGRVLVIEGLRPLKLFFSRYCDAQMMSSSSHSSDVRINRWCSYKCTPPTTTHKGAQGTGWWFAAADKIMLVELYLTFVQLCPGWHRFEHS